MKTLFLIRHAKSSWENASQSDFDRPLNDRGKRDAPRMAQRLFESKKDIEVFISSPAKRAKKTAEIFVEAFKVKEKNFLIVNALYEASVESFYATVSAIDDKFESAGIFSHNPGITEFVNSLTDQMIMNMPTCSVFGVECDIKSWKKFRDSKKKFILFDFPKNEP